MTDPASTITIYTDGACKGNPGPGGWGAHEKELWGGEKLTTNNRMELTAVIQALSALKRKMDPRTVNGGVFLGLNGIVIKSHGSADAFSFGNAIQEAVNEVHKNVPVKIQQELSQHLEEGQPA